MGNASSALVKLRRAITKERRARGAVREASWGEVAKRIGVCEQTIYRALRTGRLSPKTEEKLIKAGEEK